MKVDFYTDTPNHDPTVENYLFSDQYSLIMHGQTIEHDGTRYHVNRLEWLDEYRHFLNAYVWKFPERGS